MAKDYIEDQLIQKSTAEFMEKEETDTTKCC